MISFVMIIVSYKNTTSGAKIKFVIVVIAKMGTTSKAENFGGEAVDEIYGSMKHIGPKEFRERRVEHKGKARFNYVIVFSLDNTILLVSVGAREVMKNALSGEIIMQGAIFTTPLWTNNFRLK